MSDISVTEHIGYLLKQLQHGVRSKLDKKLRPLGISTAHFSTLAMVHELGVASGADLARRCFVTPQTVTTLIVALEREGAIKRSPSSHGRVIEARLTPKGKMLLEHAHSAALSIEDSYLSHLTEDGRQTFAAILRSCIAQLGAGSINHIDKPGAFVLPPLEKRKLKRKTLPSDFVG